MIRAGVDAWNLPGDRRGIGRYVRALLDQWSANFSHRIQTTLIVPEWHTWTVARRYNAAAGNAQHRVRSRHHHGRADLDLLWFPFNGPSWSGFSLPSVATLHDASTFVLPGFGDEARATFRLAAQKCNQIITDSDFSKAELERALRLPPECVTRIYPGVQRPLPPESATPDTLRFGRFALFVGECEGRKGFDTLEEALRILRDRNLVVPLVAAGKPRDLEPRESANVRILGHVDDRTLAELYRRCAVFIYPSRYEGFGLPVLEAMSYGAPVVASSAAAIPEAGGDAAIYFPAGDASQLAALLERVWLDSALAADLRARGLTRAQAMTWSKTAAATLDVFERVAQS